MKQYQDLLRKIREQGVDKLSDVRTKYADGKVAGYYSIDSEMLKFDLRDGHPLSTLSKKSFHLILTELLWFINGDTDLKTLTDQNNPIWTKNAWDQSVRDGNTQTLQEFTETHSHYDMGPIYGQQWRDFGGVDQLQGCIDKLRNAPNDRRMIVSAWNPPELEDMALPPCHLLYQFFSYPMSHADRCEIANMDLTSEELDDMGVPRRYINMCMYQRSVDTLLGLPFNISSYATLLQLVARTVNAQPRVLSMALGDCHIYDRHLDQVDELLTRSTKDLPSLLVAKKDNLEDYTYEDFKLLGYNPHPMVKGEMAI